MNVGNHMILLEELSTSGLLTPPERDAVAFALRLIERGIKNAQHIESGVPLWSNVSRVFGHGSTYSIQLCEAFGVDPHAKWEEEDDDA